MPYRETGYDSISLANGTRAEIETAKDKLNTYEPVIATDNNTMLFKDANGELQEIGKPKGSVDTIADLKASRGYILGDVVQVLGFYSKGDGAHHLRIAKDVDDGSGEQGQNGIWWCVVHSGEVNVSWFGAKGDGVADCEIEFKKITDYVKTSGNIKVIAKTKNKYFFNNGLKIPKNSNLLFNKIYDFGGCTLKTGTDFFIEIVGDNYENIFDSATEEGKYSFGLTIKNVSLMSDIPVKYGLKLFATHQRCIFSDIFSNDCETVVYAKFPYYSTFERITSASSTAGVGSRFIFEAENNLMTIKKCIPTNAGIGFEFKGGVTALTFSENSLEGLTHGIVFNDNVYNAKIDGCYVEAVIDSMIKFKSYFEKVIVSSNYLNGIGYSFAMFDLGDTQMLPLRQAKVFGCHLGNGATYFKDNQLLYNSNIDIDDGEYNLNENFDNRISIKAPVGTIINSTGSIVNKAKVTHYEEVRKGNFDGSMTQNLKQLGAGQRIYDAEAINVPDSGKIILDTKIKYSNTQCILVSIALADRNGIAEFNGMIVNEFYKEFSNNQRNIKVLNQNGYVRLECSLDSVGTYNTFGGEIRVI